MKKTIRLHQTIILLSAIAILNAAYLTYIALYETGSFCDITHSMSCSNVFSFDWSSIRGVPFPVFAMIVYPLIAFFAWKGRSYDSSSIVWRKYTAITATAGILFNCYFLAHEIIDQVYCPLCLICLGIIISISIMSWRKHNTLSQE